MLFSFLLRSLALVTCVTFAIVLSTLYSFNQFARPLSSISGDCIQVAGVVQPEDIQIDFDKRRAFIASAGDDGRGGIFALSIDDPLDSKGWKDLTNGVPVDFQPKGLHLFEDGDVSRLFVINGATNAVEIFKLLDGGGLRHLETLSDRRLTSPSDIVGTGPRSFYVANHADARRNGFLWKLKFVGRAKSGSVLHFNGTAFRVAATSLQFASGLSIAENGRTLVVSETAGASLSIFDVSKSSGSLLFRERVSLNAGPDKLNTAFDGSLLVAAHPKPLKLAFGGHANKTETPSLVVKMKPSGVKGASTAEVFASNGDAIAGARVADGVGETLVIGALQEDKFLICDAQ